MVKPIRRVVTGHDDRGRAIVISDAPAPSVHINKAEQDWFSVDIWRTHDMPAKIVAKSSGGAYGGTSSSDADPEWHCLAHQQLSARIRGVTDDDACGFVARLRRVGEPEGCDLR